MTELTPLNLYVCANVLLVLAAALVEGVRAVSPRLRQPMAYRHQLRLSQAAVLAALLLPLFSSSSSGSGLLPLTAQVWSAPAAAERALPGLNADPSLVSFGPSSATLPLDLVRQVALIVFVAGLVWVLARLARDALATARIIADAQTIRRHRSLRILASERCSVPFSFWVPGRCYVVVPSALVLRAEDLRLAIRHELQHHRQHDTKSVYLQQLLRACFFWNPAVHRLEAQLRELQEFCCDEALSRQGSVSALSYCQCLLRVAEAAAQQRPLQLQAGMIGGGAGKLLRRRIEALLARPSAPLRPSLVFGGGVAMLLLMAMAALAVASTVQDRRISLREAERMAEVARRSSTFPVVVNDRVVKELNRLLSAPEGRAELQASLGRMRGHEAFISERLAEAGMPLELLAVPLVESGYRNRPQDAEPRHGAGLWMFIASTARSYGLTVDAERDDRLDVAAETGAAIRLFSALYAQFQDWSLALLAYNAGAAPVQRALAETGARDAWALIASGHENDPGYLPRVMAAILVLQNPTVLE
jgi:beta-lactamase regulating signal transducer with metallopeptidase domain